MSESYSDRFKFHVGMWDLYDRDEPGYGIIEVAKSASGEAVNALEDLKRYAHIPASFSDSRMKDFNWTVYRAPDGSLIDTRKHKIVADQFVLQYEKWKAAGVGLYIHSKTRGSGKTFLACCIANELIHSRRIRTRFISASELIQNEKESRSDALDRYDRDRTAQLCNVELLIIDDLGATRSGADWMNDIVFRIIDSRNTNALPTIITSNQRIEELNMDDRITNKLNSLCSPIPLPEISIRSKQAHAKQVGLFKELGII